MSESNLKLRTAIREIGIQPLADASGVPYKTIHTFLNDPNRNMRSDNLEKLQKAIKELERENLSVPDREEFLSIPIFDIRASAGHGALVADEHPIGFQPFRPQELKRLTRAPMDALAVIRIAGDSMSPFLADGDHALVDTTVRKIGRDAIYVVALGDDLVAKRCEIDIQTGNILVRSDNPLYQTKIVKEADRIDVKGRVVWIARALG